jgi:hypothetical protein
MTARIIALPPFADHEPIAQNLHRAFPIKNAPDDLMDLWDACKAALDNIHDKEALDCLDTQLDKLTI